MIKIRKHTFITICKWIDTALQQVSCKHAESIYSIWKVKKNKYTIDNNICVLSIGQSKCVLISSCVMSFVLKCKYTIFWACTNIDCTNSVNSTNLCWMKLLI